MKCDACKKRVKFWEGSDPKCAFACGPEWSSDNWNCATTGILRRVFDDAVYGTKRDERIAYQWSDDRNVGMLLLGGAGIKDRPLSLWITWYKSRGRTEQVWLLFDDKPPRRPTEEEVLSVTSAYSSNV